MPGTLGTGYSNNHTSRYSQSLIRSPRSPLPPPLQLWCDCKILLGNRFRRVTSSTTYFFMRNAKEAQKLSHADALEGFNIIRGQTTVNFTLMRNLNYTRKLCMGAKKV